MVLFKLWTEGLEAPGKQVSCQATRHGRKSVKLPARRADTDTIVSSVVTRIMRCIVVEQIRRSRGVEERRH